MRTRRRLLGAAAALLAGVAVTVGAAAEILPAAEFAPSEPYAHDIGFSSGADGAVEARIGPESWPLIDTIRLRDTETGVLVWESVRTGPEPEKRGLVAVGTTPDGFTTTVSNAGDATEVDMVAFGECDETWSGVVPNPAVIPAGQTVSGSGAVLDDAHFTSADELMCVPGTTFGWFLFVGLPLILGGAALAAHSWRFDCRRPDEGLRTVDPEA